MKQFPASNIVASITMLCLLAGSGAALAAEPAANGTSKIGSVEQLLKGLKAKLEAQPADAKGWVLLAKSYHHLGYSEEAHSAAAKARALGFTGEILPLPSGHPEVGSSNTAGALKASKHHHRHAVGSDAGSYVSSFFAEQEKHQVIEQTQQATEGNQQDDNLQDNKGESQ